MMQSSMFGPLGLGADSTEYDALDDAACALIPACTAARIGRGAAGAAGAVVDDSLAKAQQAATQVTAPMLAELQRLERTITWAAVGCIVALALATGTVIYVAASKQR